MRKAKRSEWFSLFMVGIRLIRLRNQMGFLYGVIHKKIYKKVLLALFTNEC